MPESNQSESYEVCDDCIIEDAIELLEAFDMEVMDELMDLDGDEAPDMLALMAYSAVTKIVQAIGQDDTDAVRGNAAALGAIAASLADAYGALRG